MQKALFTTILMLNSVFLIAQEPKLSEIIQAKKKVGDHLFKTGSSLDELKLERQQKRHNKTPLDWGEIGEYLEQASGQESQKNSRSEPKRELNVYLTRTEERIGARLCHYSNGSVVRVEAGWPCPM